MNNTEYLQHYGVLGMKWGKRKAQNYGSRRNVRNSKIYKAGSKINKANSTRKKIKKEYRDIMVRESPISRAIYSPQAYKKAAKNVVKKGMDRKTAIKKAKTSALIQSGAALAASALSILGRANSDKIAKYVNERSIQKANASLARIGTFTYEKVAGDVYNRVMR